MEDILQSDYVLHCQKCHPESVTARLAAEVERLRTEKARNVDMLQEATSALADILDGQCRWHEIRDQTGCTEQRSREIESIGKRVLSGQYR